MTRLLIYILYFLIFHGVIFYIILPKSIFYPPKEITFDEFVKNRDRYRGYDVTMKAYIFYNKYKGPHFLIIDAKNKSKEIDLFDYKNMIVINDLIGYYLSTDFIYPENTDNIISDDYSKEVYKKEETSKNYDKSCIDKYVKIYGWVGEVNNTTRIGFRNIYKIEVYKDENYNELLFVCYDIKNIFSE